MCKRLWIVASCLPLAFLGACGGSSDPPKCVPGVSPVCGCANGQQGSQTCTSAGTYTPCVCATPGLDAGGASDIDSPVAGAPDSALVGDSPEAQPDRAMATPDAQPGAQPDAASALPDRQPDTAPAVPDAQPDSQPDIPGAILTVDKSSVEFGSNGEGLDGGAAVDAGGAVTRPIELGSSGVATVVVTNSGNAASGALAVVTGAEVTTSGCYGALAPAATCSLTITATPTTLGQFSSSVSIWASPGALTPIQITVSAVVMSPLLITSFNASPTVVSSGGSSTLTAVFSNGIGTVDHGIGTVTSGIGTSTGPINADTTYTLTVTDGFGYSRTAQVQVRLSIPNCMGLVISNGYACGSVTACSACTSNGTSREAACKNGIDCLAARGVPCDGNCMLTCLNSAGADSQTAACITALQNAACSGTGSTGC